MFGVISQWYQKHFSNPQLVILVLIIITGFALVLFAGDVLLPVFAGIIIAYLLEGLVVRLQNISVPRLAAIVLVMFVSMAFIFIFTFGLFPLLTHQVTELVRDLPQIISKIQNLLLQLPEQYPDFISQDQIKEFIGGVGAELAGLGQKIASVSLHSLVGVLTFMVYLVMVPLMVFFFLKDKQVIIHWAMGFLPTQRGLSTQVWDELNHKILCYVRGKFIEIMIVWVACYIAFALFGLHYAMLLAFLVGLSVIIPYVGAVVVTIPVVLIAWFQWGPVTDFVYVVITYLVIQAIDGTVIVPLLFAEVVNLHPLAIIIAVLFFGGVWGVWGVFFAIPLATLIQAVIKEWPAPLEQTS